jgi:hydrogenase maturation protease
MFVPKTDNLLLIAIGNVARGDDGLGWQLADRIKDELPKNCTIEYRYQLQVEDALMLAEFDAIIFVDATETSYSEGFAFTPCFPATHYFFSSHQQSPETLLYLTEQLYQKRPKSFLLAISGYQWELGEIISDEAKMNLESAIRTLKSFVYQEGMEPLPNNRLTTNL